MHQESDDRIKYLDFVNRQPHVPIFLKAEWLDAVAGNGKWRAFFYEVNNNIVATYTVYETRRYGIKVSSMPPLTQFLGMWADSSVLDKSLYHRTAVLHDAQRYFISKLDKYNYLTSRSSHYIDCFLPYIEADFKVSPRYTYRFEAIHENDFCNSLHSSQKRNLAAGEQMFSFERGTDPEEFYSFLRDSCEVLGRKVFYSYDTFQLIYRLCIGKNWGEIFSLRDESQDLTTSIFVVWDQADAYHLIPVSKRGRVSGVPYLISKLLNCLPKSIRNYDFEGSMISGIERHYRSMSSARRIYYAIRKTPFCKLPLIN